MTENKKITNGVDVNECEHQTYDKCAINFDEWNGEIIRYLDCSNYPNCHFKQLKRKEQECEELKEKLERQKDYTITYKSYIYEEEKQLKKQLQAKEQECEKLKTQILSLQIMKIEEYKKLKQECKELKKQYNCYACGTCKGKEDYRNMKRHCENSIKANHRYKQSLDEIEKYIKGSSGYYIPYGAIKIIQYIINKAKEQQ